MISTSGNGHRGVFPMVSHLPDSWPVAVGAALAFKLRNEPRVALAFCGDGATSSGTWHEAINLASVFEVPVVFVIENNQYAYSTPTERQSRVKSVADRAAAYGMPGKQIDGNDVVDIYVEVQEAAERARAGGGPSLIEAVTMRMDGHAIHDGAQYVPKDTSTVGKGVIQSRGCEPDWQLGESQTPNSISGTWQQHSRLGTLSRSHWRRHSPMPRP